MESKLKEVEGEAIGVTDSAPEYGRVSVPNTVKDSIARHPGEALLISLATGFLLGHLLGGAQQQHCVAKSLDISLRVMEVFRKIQPGEHLRKNSGGDIELYLSFNPSRK